MEKFKCPVKKIQQHFIRDVNVLMKNNTIFFSRKGLGLVDVGKRVFTVHITAVQSTFDYTSLANIFMLSVSTTCHSVARTTCGERKTFWR